MRAKYFGLGDRLGSASARYRHPWTSGGFFTSPSRGISHLSLSANSGKTHESEGDGASNAQLTRLEAVFFLSQQPQTSRKLAQLAGLADGTKARTLVRTLNRRYDAEGSAFRVEEVAGGFQLMTRAKFAPWLRRLHSAATEIRLSAPAMETLAVVAYRQPVLRAEVEAIRGVQSDEVLRQLIERDLIRIAGRSEELGRPFLYGTTKNFLQVFGLRHLDELPRAEQLRGTVPATTPEPINHETDPNIQDPLQPFPEAEEETIVKSLTRVKPRQDVLTEDNCATVTRRRRNDCFGSQDVFNKSEDEDEDLDDDDDLDEEEDDDEPWEEVDDEDDDLEDDDEDDDWEEDEDWDEDDDFDDDEDEDWDDDEEEEEDEEV